MKILPEEAVYFSASEKQLLKVLREKGPQTLDNLCGLPDMDWPQVLLAVDRLSRTGTVAIEPIASREYQVSLCGAWT
jgi:hypothetical protein